MLTALLLAHALPASAAKGFSRRDPLLRGLSFLVEACVAGLVADAVLVGRPGMGLDRLADEAGCGFVEDADAAAGFARGLALARRELLLVLNAGFVPERRLIEELFDALEDGGDAALILRAAPDSLLTRLAPGLAPPVGVVAGKELLRAAGAAETAALARKLGGRSLAARATA